MNDNEFRASQAGGQPTYSHPYYQQPVAAAPVLTAPRPKKKRVAVLVTASTLAAAVIGGASGAAIVGLDTGPSTGALPTASATTVSNTTNTDVSAVAAKVLPSVVQVNVTTRQGEAIGSGVILSSDGKILTNAHVVSGSVGDVTITLSNGTKYQASVLGADTKADIAVLQAKNASGLTAATLGDSSALQVGQQVVAIGSPGGLQNTVTSGIVSALNRQLSDISSGEQNNPFGQTANTSSDSPSYTAIQTDASINQGNSGGPLVNMNGEVIGINSALYSPSSTSAGSVGIGFAIPINDAKTIIQHIENN
ncbi:S1C family serine protease [Amycolatopsis thermophila]|uniref:Serine protease PepD n=1 Tax=Amycolatopsis thermophila TaxID=206084 RepID=A0ABU0EW12_9PSEU|nr:trypsin-like peptidase domain-containing protein [Amycolatopsis thermophila]MDQ0379501.1 putative serine protease PepD [Amycolatopsis thermophila]